MLKALGATYQSQRNQDILVTVGSSSSHTVWVRRWNSLDQEMVNAPSVNAFKVSWIN